MQAICLPECKNLMLPFENKGFRMVFCGLVNNVHFSCGTVCRKSIGLMTNLLKSGEKSFVRQ